MTDDSLVTPAWTRTLRLAERGDGKAIARMAQLVNAVLDVRGAFLRGEPDAPAFAREVVIRETAYITGG